jgi:hypothetical protein
MKAFEGVLYGRVIKQARMMFLSIAETSFGPSVARGRQVPGLFQDGPDYYMGLLSYGYLERHPTLPNPGKHLTRPARTRGVWLGRAGGRRSGQVVGGGHGATTTRSAISSVALIRLS